MSSVKRGGDADGMVVATRSWKLPCSMALQRSCQRLRLYEADSRAFLRFWRAGGGGRGWNRGVSLSRMRRFRRARGRYSARAAAARELAGRAGADLSAQPRFLPPLHLAAGAGADPRRRADRAEPLLHVGLALAV